MHARTVIVGIAALVIFLFTILMVSRMQFKGEQARTMMLSTPVGGDFSIPSTNGVFETKEHRGKVLFLFFGFVHCPHICPMTLANLNQMLSQLPLEDQLKALGVFVTVDPERDSFEVLENRLASSKGRIIGARDTDENLAKVLRLFGARSSRIKGDDGAVLIDHTSQIFVINRKGEWVESLEYNATPEELLAAYRSADSKPTMADKAPYHRAIEILAGDESCDIGKGPCVVRTAEGEEFELELGPAPVTIEKELTLKVRTTSTHFVPMEADFEGVELSLGYIRPVLTEVGEGQYEAKVTLPLCELPAMRWRVHLIAKETQGPQLSALTFSFHTVKEP